jgi:hypothetical protein
MPLHATRPYSMPFANPSSIWKDCRRRCPESITSIASVIICYVMNINAEFVRSWRAFGRSSISSSG